MAKCPHCKGEVTFENVKMQEKGQGVFRQESMYICPHCDCIIAISRGKYR
jgi:phage terminase large subunit GpA-like protein